MIPNGVKSLWMKFGTKLDDSPLYCCYTEELYKELEMHLDGRSVGREVYQRLKEGEASTRDRSEKGT